MIEYQDKTILITGASSGIGESLAIKLDKLGANLILTARSKDKLDKLALKMNNAIVVAGDLSDRDFPPNLYDEIVSKNIEIDILINNAGFGYSGLFLDSSLDNYKEMLDLNIYGLTSLTHLFLPAMVKRGSGGIINISSLASYQPIPYFTVYAATKAYVTSFTLGLYEEYREKGIKVLGVCPGYTKTNFNKRASMDSTNPATGYIMTSDTVAEQSLKAYEQGKFLIINGAINKFTRWFMNFIPKSLALKIAKKIIKKGLEKGNW
tara:strand:+ start:1176 stop:1967 length:792 start_codon:yes stop_codon:yes gene_type:complete